MARLAALLRGINLGSRNRIGMADLRALVAGLGYDDAQTLLQSGNVVFTTGDQPGIAARRIEEALAREAGLDVPVLVRTRRELARIVALDPLREHVTDPKRYLVVFLAEPADRARLRGLDPAELQPDRFHAERREVYVWLPRGFAKARLGHAFWEHRLGVTATGRNWSTVEKLLALAGG